MLVQIALVQFQHYLIKMINGRNLMCYYADLSVINEDDWKVYLPQSMIQDVIQWYHMMLGHQGVTRVYDTIQYELLDPIARDYQFITETTFVLIIVISMGFFF